MAVGFLTQPLVRNCHTLCLLNGDGWSWMIMDGDGLVAPVPGLQNGICP
jgi:hypothetical protein